MLTLRGAQHVTLGLDPSSCKACTRPAILLRAAYEKAHDPRTKWLGDIPVEAGCTARPGVVFQAKGSAHRPNREEYQKSV
jgi:hypothetical protein